MERSHYALDKPGKSVIMLGNEAVARGILEAGTIIGAGYPGTPSSEILKTLASMENYFPHLKLEWSINEKVGLEVAIAGSMSDVRSVACMKHVGVNVAADAFMTIAYAGARGGLVVVSADDPNLYSSQNEQDNRFYGLHGLVPVFEPSTPQEAKDMMKYAFEFSEKYETVVLFRTTTRLNHGRGNVVLGEIQKPKTEHGFDWDRERWVCLPSHSRVLRKNLLERMDIISQDVNQSHLNGLNLSEQTVNGKKIGFISAGIPYSHLKDALSYLEIEDKVSTLKLGIVYPLPRKLIIKLLKNVDKLLVIEELEPIIETLVKKIAFEEGFVGEIEIVGKDLFPQNFEFPAELVIEKVAKFTNKEFELSEIPHTELKLPPRLPVLCPGCSHRATFYAINKLEKKLKKQFINSSDIGCYTLGVYKPLEAIDAQICMGGSIGMANGFSKLYGDDQPLLAILGDSTFFHTGVPGLVNAVYNQNNMLIVILDNRSTSMTGFQDNPGTGVKITKKPGTRVIIEDLVKGCGVPEENIWLEDSNDIDKMVEKLEDAINAEGVRVFISRHICSLLEMGEFKARNITPPTYKIDKEACIGCQICYNQFGCPAINFNEKLRKASIDQSLCRGCGVCEFICPQGAIHEETQK
ncbi:MAG: indolepyruvate ferredoxin oxidoreductase subunit alpha [Candidatus Lokiarchaeota archaeon]|nr:indolepyruvate ferredoxin oxidoreductase subunit alpha [Candidatus Lokiarchaeota archaeon]MBD3202642.1 indolepyruvate ferredoxin oxidoreductase subunit alpha [Candidatus Lokiarchaeota archaeon]